MEDNTLLGYRVRQLEEQLRELGQKSETLTVAQIRQMLAVIGIPVAVAGGVFGVALWQVIGDVAERRAEETAASIAEVAAETVAEEVAGAAAEQPAMDAARTEFQAFVPQLREVARNEAAQEAARIAENVARQAGSEAALTAATFVSSTRAAATLVQQPEFIAQVSSGALVSLEGAVVAFVDGCPEQGWVPFEDGAGKFLLGAGSGTLVYGEASPHRPDGAPEFVRLTAVNAGDQGGAETHALTEPEMPRHQHLPGGNIDRLLGYDNDGRSRTYQKEAHESVHVTTSTATAFAGGLPDETTKPHNNMPPYIALHFCKKEAG